MSELERVEEDERAPVRTLPSPGHVFSFIILAALFSTGLGIAGTTLFFASGVVPCIAISVLFFVAAMTTFVIHSRRRVQRADAVMAGYQPDALLEAEDESSDEPEEKEEPRWRHPSIRRAIARQRKSRVRRKKALVRRARANADTNFSKMFSYVRSGYVGAAAPVGSALMVGGGLYLSSVPAAATARALSALMAMLVGFGLLVFYGISIVDAWRLRRAEGRRSENEAR